MTTTDKGLRRIRALRQELVGLDVEVPVLGGGLRRYVTLDSASSTPTFRPVLEKVDEFLRYYSNVHRGEGYKSQFASWAFEEARGIVARFVGADPDHDTVIFTRNTTESINKLARIYPFHKDPVVLTTLMEHHSNDLPWRRRAEVVHAGLRPDGSLDLDDFRARLARCRGRLDLVAVTGASNVTGWVNDIHLLARLAHEVGAKIVVDAAQLGPHRPVAMKPAGDPEHLDFVAFSGHKLYAPYGVGALVGDRAALLAAEPDNVGGGTVDIVTTDSASWRDLPEREEAGTPDIVGAVALAAAIRLIESLGWPAIIAHEERLTRRLLERLAAVPGLRIHGKTLAPDISDRLGVVAFNLGDLPHALVAAILSYEGGIGVRNGCFCAHPYVLCLLGVSEGEAEAVRREIIGRDRSRVPGAVRASIGLQSDESDVDALCDCLEMIAEDRHAGRYELCCETGAWRPAGEPCFRFADRFSFDPRLP
ncbi:MAG: aminotransferase class V-fold PLP-dependent enzyme [bacterium]